MIINETRDHFGHGISCLVPQRSFGVQIRKSNPGTDNQYRCPDHKQYRSDVPLCLIFDVLEGLADLGLDLVAELGVILEELLHSLTSLGELLLVVAEPGAALADDAVLYAQVDDLTDFGDSLTEHDVEFGLFERWSHLVLDHLDPRPVAEGFLTVLELGDPADVDAH